MKKVRIITEGEHETYFLVYFFQKFYDFRPINEDKTELGKHYFLLFNSIEIEIQSLTNLSLDGLDTKLTQIRNLVPIIKKWQEKEKIIFILDAEEQINKKGFTKRVEQLNTIKKDNDLIFNFYIFPNHEEENGNFDDFLWSILNTNEFVEAKNCIDNYVDCLKASDSKYKILDKKGKINAYLNLIDERNQHKVKDYDKNSWLFDFENNKYLQKLKNFLDPYLN